MFVFRFFGKKWKVKNAYMDLDLERKLKSLLYKSTLIFCLGGSEKELGAHLYFFGGTPLGPFPHT